MNGEYYSERLFSVADELDDIKECLINDLTGEDKTDISNGLYFLSSKIRDKAILVRWLKYKEDKSSSSKE